MIIRHYRKFAPKHLCDIADIAKEVVDRFEDHINDPEKKYGKLTMSINKLKELLCQSTKEHHT